MTSSIAHNLKAGMAATAILAQLATAPANAFCGFYVTQADAKLFNKSSKVVLARDGEETAITMASDYEGDVKEFAVVVPVPTFIERKQIGVVDPKTIDHIDRYTAPRLVEYFDEDPCSPKEIVALAAPPMMSVGPQTRGVEQSYGVTIEASYDIAEYDVLILSAKEGDGLVAWLTDNHYRIPQGAERVLGSYIKQSMRFFIAKVNTERMKAIGKGYLRPLQVRYQSAKFMVPLRLGTVNAKGPQDMVILALSKQGRVESSNYRTIKVASGVEVPLYVKDEFGPFYEALFERSVAKANMHAVFVECAWDMGWCDPCAAEPLKNKELVELGARWIASDDDEPFQPAGDADAFVTRLHVRYDAAHFPEDLAFMETKDRENFQGRYVLQHPFEGRAACSAGDHYWQSLPERYRREADTLADLTGWHAAEIQTRMEATGQSFAPKPADSRSILDWIFQR